MFIIIDLQCIICHKDSDEANLSGMQMKSNDGRKKMEREIESYEKAKIITRLHLLHLSGLVHVWRRSYGRRRQKEREREREKYKYKYKIKKFKDFRICNELEGGTGLIGLEITLYCRISTENQIGTMTN
ncbi:hypothetical protein C0J52_02876 [Blattella germanica]|nr:hypothetical protein C0J52_02876 [Blattella germanica]